jgi:hypothetical protein
VSGLGTGVATFLATPSSANLRGAITDETGTGLAYFQGGALGTPSSGTGTNLTGIPISTGVSGLGTGVGTALGTNIGTAGSFVVNGGALGTPSSGVGTNLTGIPISSAVSGLGTGMATWLGTPSSANLRATLTDETGTGAAYFQGGDIGTPSAGVGTNITGVPISTGVSGLGTGVATAAGNNLSAAAGLTTTIASGTAALGTVSIASATCATAVTTVATNVATTDVVTASFNGDPTAVTGYVPSTSGMLSIIGYPTAGNVVFKVCNNTAGSITPGAITLNWRVVR